jgi:transcriptional regulator with XRE-family HTH domain
LAHSILAQMLGVYVVEERKKQGINQAQLAHLIGCTPQFLGRFEKGEVMLPERLLVKCVSTLDLKYDRLKKIYRLNAERGVDDIFEGVATKAAKRVGR